MSNTNDDISNNENSTNENNIKDIIIRIKNDEINEDENRIDQNRNKYISYNVFIILFLLIVLWFYKLISFSIKNNLYNIFWICSIFVSIFILLFPIQICVSCIFNIFAPTNFFFENSKYYSCKKEEYIIKKNIYVTIQIPVYKEDFDTVIKPTLQSALRCEKFYNCNNYHKIKVNIFVNDDGLQLISNEERIKRITFYNNNKIGYVARPVENRKGKFKKASNMNFCIEVSKYYSKIEKIFTHEAAILFTKNKYLIDKDMNILLDNNITIGKYILLLDSDTRIPYNCLNNVIPEFEKYKNLGFTQHLTHPLIISKTYWQEFIAHFTSLIYELAISISVAGGDVSPLVGHCAIIRTSALYELQFKYNTCIWSENHVSEDFKLFMDLVSLGYYGRYITYTNNIDCINENDFEINNFMEGISLEYIDELIKFKKYTYGACEILFNPINEWFKKGIIGESIYDYCNTDIEFTSKLGIISYLFTYLSISIGLPLSYINYIIYGWFYKYYENVSVLPLYIIIQVSILFTGISTIANTIFKARILHNDMINILWSNIKHIPYYLLFFGSLSYHFNIIILNYLFNRHNISWGSTNKEITLISRKEALLFTLKEFKLMYILFISTLIIVIIMSSNLVSNEYRITRLNAIMPIILTSILHITGPILLNHNIMLNIKKN